MTGEQSRSGKSPTADGPTSLPRLPPSPSPAVCCARTGVRRLTRRNGRARFENTQSADPAHGRDQQPPQEEQRTSARPRCGSSTRTKRSSSGPSRSNSRSRRHHRGTQQLPLGHGGTQGPGRRRSCFGFRSQYFAYSITESPAVVTSPDRNSSTASGWTRGAARVDRRMRRRGPVRCRRGRPVPAPTASTRRRGSSRRRWADAARTPMTSIRLLDSGSRCSTNTTRCGPGYAP